MPHIQLPGDNAATIHARGALTERKVRSISNAYMAALGVIGKLEKAGYDPTNSTTWHAYNELTPEERDALNGHEAALIVAFVKEWSLGTLPTTESVLDLPSDIFTAIKEACEAEWMGSTKDDFGPDGVANPLAPGVASTGSDSSSEE